jgi:hypothetical protein
MYKDNRVLIRRGARELTVDETSTVGGSVNTFVCTFPLPPVTLTGAADGDACGHGDLDHA